MRIDSLVKPRSVAIVGATDRTSPARSVIESLGAIGFTGAIYPVNPKYQSVLNHVCYPSLAEVPEAPDVVVFSIRKTLIPEQIRRAVDRGARAAVIYDSGFAELGDDGAALQDGNAGLWAQLHGYSQSDGARHHLQADSHGSWAAGRECRLCLPERLRLHRHPFRSAPLRHQPFRFRRQ
ncbi:MAG: hypothetical protein E6G96_18190 [Alphaproteobacteria bacterium]|nr:MAG: hypothetical protein E6G96_18190 [Alphaproteobacteria bacterium]